MRLLIVTGLYPPESGGPATYSKLLYDKLPNFGFEVEVLPFRDVRHLPNIVCHIVYFLKILRKGKNVDIIYAQDTISVGWPAYMANKFLKRKFIVRVPGDHVWEQGVQRFGVKEMLDDFPAKLDDYHPYLRFLRYLQRKVVCKSDAIVVPSKYLKKIACTWGVEPEKIHVIYNGFTAPEILETKNDIKRAFGVAGEVVISAGRLVPWKGFSCLIDVVGHLKSERPSLKLYIVGEGPDKKILEEKVKMMSLENKVIFVGQISHDLLLKYLKMADVFVLNSGYEGLSHLLLESMSLGTPIVTTKAGGNLELIKNGKSGLIIDHNDKEAIGESIRKILSDESLRVELSSNSKTAVGNFSKEKMIYKISTLLNKTKGA